MASCLDNLALVHADRGQAELAKAGYERALRIRERSLPPDHPDIAQSLDHLAAVERKLGAHAEAKALDERALAIHQRRRLAGRDAGRAD